MFDDPIFLPVAMCKQANIEWIMNKCPKIIISKYLAPEEGGKEGIHIRFLCKRSKQYVEFGI